MKRKEKERERAVGEAQSQAPLGGKTVSSAPNASFEGWSGQPGFDSPPEPSYQLSNPEAGVQHEATPYYPPGGAPDESMAPTEEPGAREQGAGEDDKV